MNATTPDSPRSGKYRVLIVDDHPIVRHGLSELTACQPDLEICGEASNVAEAMEQVERHRPDVAVIDIALGGEDGLELIERIKTSFPEVKMLVSSMHDETTHAGRALRAGALGYLNKRASIRKVIDAIRHILRGEFYLSSEMASRLLHRAALGEPLDNSPAQTLSHRELEVFEMVGQGLTTQQIARRLGLSPRTVETHRKKIKTKLNLQNSVQLSRAAFQWMQEIS